MNVGVLGSVAGYPRVLNRLLARVALVHVHTDQVSNEIFGRIRNLVPIRTLKFVVSCSEYGKTVSGWPPILGIETPDQNTDLSGFVRIAVRLSRRRTADIHRAECR